MRCSQRLIHISSSGFEPPITTVVYSKEIQSILQYVDVTGTNLDDQQYFLNCPYFTNFLIVSYIFQPPMFRSNLRFAIYFVSIDECSSIENNYVSN